MVVDKEILPRLFITKGGTVAPWLVRSSPNRVVWVRSLADHTNSVVFLARHHGASLHPDVLMGTGEFNDKGYPTMD